MCGDEALAMLGGSGPGAGKLRSARRSKHSSPRPPAPLATTSSIAAARAQRAVGGRPPGELDLALADHQLACCARGGT